MQLTTLTGTGLRVSRISLGTMTFGDQVDEQASISIVRRCLDAGINFFDTANIYTEGRSETILGEALQGQRDAVVLASKVRGRVGDNPNDEGLSRRHILDAIDNSLRALQTDYLDIYYLHQPDYETPLAETLSTMNDLVRAGKVRYVGISNHASWQICQSLWLCDNHSWRPPVVAQQMYNLIARGIEQEHLSFLCEFEIGLVVYNPLAGGLLTGKHANISAALPGTRFDGNQMYRDRYWHEADFDAVRALQHIAQQAGKSLVELSLQWLLGRSQVNSVILGVSNLDQLEENIMASDGELDEATEAACDEVWDKLRGPIPYYNR